MLRKLHRWTSLPLILFLLLVLGTGVFLQSEEAAKIGLAENNGASTREPTAMVVSDVAQKIAFAIEKAQQNEPKFTPRHIQYDVSKDVTRLAERPRGGPFIEVDHGSGRVKAEMKPETPLHVWMIRLHTGSVLGGAGVVVMLLSSLILLFLAISGSVLYWQMWRNRAQRGKKQVFWK